MKYVPVISVEAETDINEAAKCYENQSNGLGFRFLHDFRLRLKSICKTPFGFAVRSQKLRAIPLRDFPFLIYYDLETKKGEVLVLAVLHSHRNPETWKKRVK